MKNKQFLIGMFSMILALGVMIIACNANSHPNLSYSIRVNNPVAPKAIIAGDTVELYIHNFEYLEDENPRALIIIAEGDRWNNDGSITNAGWYSVDADLAVRNDVNPGPYSSFHMRISKLRVNGTEYDFPIPNGGESHRSPAATFGNPPSIWHGGQSDYPDNFSGIVISNSDVSLKTVLTVEPGIFDENNNLVADPYRFIKVEGRINE